jgi:hypothetical protein
MNLRDALNLCQAKHSDDWTRMPGGQNGRPATAIVAGLFDPGSEEPAMRPLAGHSFAVYEQDARLSLVWPVPEDDDYLGRAGERFVPEWAEQDTHEWKNARPGWAVVLLGGAPIWQDLFWYLDWGSGVGGYVPDYQPVFADSDPGEAPELERWETSTWAVGLAGLLNVFSASGEWYTVDPTARVDPSPSPIHPIDAQRSGY